MKENKKASSNSASNWLGKTMSAFKKEREDEDDVKFYKREKVGDRVKKYGIKVGATFFGHIGNDTKKTKDTYTVMEVNTDKNVAILKGKKDEKIRRVSFLNKIFE